MVKVESHIEKSIDVEEVLAALREQLGEITDPQSLRTAFNKIETRFAVVEPKKLLPSADFFAIHTKSAAHKHAEQVAQRNLAYLRAVIDQLPQGLTVIDENLDIVLWNRMWEKNSGARPGFLFQGVTFAEALRQLAEMGEYGPGDIEEQISTRVALARRFEPHCFRRLRPNGNVV